MTTPDDDGDHARDAHLAIAAEQLREADAFVEAGRRRPEHLDQAVALAHLATAHLRFAELLQEWRGSADRTTAAPGTAPVVGLSRTVPTRSSSAR